MSAKVLVLALDACDPAVVSDMIAEGELPNLAEMLRTGVQAPLHHERGVYVGSIWPTMMTGQGVARHGRFAGVHFAPGTYEQVEDPALVEPFWDALDRAGLRSATVDVPFFPAQPSDNTTMLVEWGCHDRYYGTSSWPADLVDRVEDVAGQHRLGTHSVATETRFSPCDLVARAGGMRTPEESVQLFDMLVESIDRKTAASTWMLDEADHDLFITVYGETHCVGHQFWHIHDPRHPWHEPALAARIGDPVGEIYRRADRALGEHRSLLAPDAVTYVILSHGMRWHHCANFLLDEMLHRLEAVRLGRPTPWLGPRTAAVGRGLDIVPSSLRPAVVQSGASLVRRRHAGRSMEWRDPPISYPPAGRLWFDLPNNTVSGGVRMNVRGREPGGVLHPDDTGEHMEWVTNRLLEIVDVATGRPAVAEVLPTAGMYHGPLAWVLPDLFVEWNPEARLDRLWSPAIGTITVPDVPPRSGDHSEHGLMIACGPGLRAGHEDPVNGVDVAPTIAAALGVMLDDADGSPVSGLLPRRMPRPQRERVTVQGSGRAEPPASAPYLSEIQLLREQVEQLRAAVAARSVGLADDILSTSSWIRNADVGEHLLVSVVLPTHNRSRIMRRAIRSVLEQTYTNLELIVVDDHSIDDTWDDLRRYEDPRMRAVRSTESPGVAGARNHGLSLATGDVIAYLDDDNWYDPEWLRSVAWLFGEQPTAQVAYGVRVVDDVERHHGRAEGGLPWPQLIPWDREHIRHNNLIDINVIAHRPSPARFVSDGDGVLADWDLVRALTQDTDPIAVPVIAAYYTTDQPDRLTLCPPEKEERIRRQIAEKWARFDGSRPTG